jgi:uncharacterized membrane protein SirB2
MTRLELFAFLKLVHITTVVITLSSFLIRAFWMLRESPLLHSRAARILPHVNDTVLLAAALGTAMLAGQLPFRDAWLTAKVLGTLGYIVLGAVGLHYGQSRRSRVLALLGALLCFAYIVAVAVTKKPLPWR